MSVGQELERAGLVVADAHRLVELQDAQGEERREAHPGEPYVERPEAYLRCPLRPALLGDQVPQAEERQPRREHPVDTHHGGVAMIGGQSGADLVVGDDGEVYEEAEDPGAEEVPEPHRDQEHDSPAVRERRARPRLLPRPELQEAPGFDRQERQGDDLRRREERAQSHVLGWRPEK